MTGIARNNPGNIRKSSDDWAGLSDPQPDGAFFTFSEPVYGLRAMAKILLGYQRRGFNTVAKIINRWAPSSENNTKSYIRDVCQRIGVYETDTLDLTAPSVMLALIKAITIHEDGSCPYPDSLIGEAMELAGLPVLKT